MKETVNVHFLKVAFDNIQFHAWLNMDKAAAVKTSFALEETNLVKSYDADAHPHTQEAARGPPTVCPLRFNAR